MSGKRVEYRLGTLTLEGYLAVDDATKPGAKRPGVPVVHEWWGINDFTRSKADELAGLGYVAFAADIYGKGLRPTTPEAAKAAATPLRDDRKLLRARARAGLEVLLRQPGVDPRRVAAVGYCFGGTTVLELARSGAALSGVVSLQGGLATPHPADAKQIKGAVLALAGGDDPMVPPAELTAFQQEMRQAAVERQRAGSGETRVEREPSSTVSSGSRPPRYRAGAVLHGIEREPSSTSVSGVR